VVDFGHPIDLSASVPIARGRRMDDHRQPETQGQYSADCNRPARHRRLGHGNDRHDLREATAFMATIPATLRLSDHVRINLNAGWMLDRVLNEHLFTYGAGFDWIVHGPWIVTGEAFGQTGRSSFGSIVKPRWQAGLRYRPVDALSFDVIYGRIITGENANWLTLAATFRFAPGAR
jgi:hypothetical protein